MSRRFFKSLGSQIAIVAPALLLVVAGFVVAYQFVGPAPPDRIVMATGSDSGSYHAFGKLYAERFRREGIELVLKTTAGSAENLSLLTARQNGAAVAFVQGGIGNPADHPGLRSLGSVYYEPIWLFARGDAPRRLTELKGKRIAIGGPGSGTQVVATMLLAENGIDARTAQLVAFGGEQAESALKNGAVDAAFFVTSVSSQTVRTLLSSQGISLMSFERADAYTRRHGFLSKLVLPTGIVDLEQNLPGRDTVLIAPAATIVMSPDMHPALVDLMLLTMHDAHRAGGHLESPGAFPAARFASFPLDDAARRFYDRGPPFLQRYLPFWAANLVDRLKVMILPLLTLLYPLFKILPPAYNWRMRSRVNRWYKRLQVLDDRLRDKGVSRADAMAELDRIEHAVEQVSVPAGFAASAYTLRLHIDYLRRKAEGHIDRGADDIAAAS